MARRYAAAPPRRRPAAPRLEAWEDVARHQGKPLRGGRSVVQVQTGYLPVTLAELWEGAAQYFMHVHDGRGQFHARETMRWRAQHYFYLTLCYIHRNSPKHNFMDEIKRHV